MDLNRESLEVLMLVGRNGPIARRTIARRLGFNTSRVTRLTDRLLKGGLIHESGQEGSMGGRPSILLDLAEANHLLAGVLVSYSSTVQVVLMDLRANILEEEMLRLTPDTGADDLVGQISAALNGCLARRSRGPGTLLGAGVGVSGLVDPRAGLIHNSPGFPSCRSVKLGAKLSQLLEIPVYLENEVALSTLAEMWYGRGKGHSNFLYFSLGPGVRMGIVIDGVLFRGDTGNAGEVGHITVDRSGPFCYCGNTGCLESIVSGDEFLATARESLDPRSTSRLADLCRSDRAALSVSQIFDAARGGDRFAQNLLRRFCRPIGLTLANMVNIFDMGQIVIGGTFAEAGDALLDILKEQIDFRSLSVPGRTVSVERAAFDRTSTAIGGGALVLQKICSGEAPLSFPE